MNFNNATHITCGNGLAVPVNPILKQEGTITDEERKLYNEFQIWASNQPELHCSPELSGTYPVDEFGEVVWQYCLVISDEWSNENSNTYNEFSSFKEYQKDCDEILAETRQFLPYIGPKKQESEPLSASEYLNLYGSADNMYLKARISSNEYFKLSEDQRRFYIRYSGQNDVHYELNPKASNQPFDFAAVLEKTKGIAFPNTPATPEQKGVEQGEENTNSGYVYRVNEIEKCYEQHLGNLTSLYVNDILTSEEYKNLTERNKDQRKIKLADLLERFKQATKNHTQQ